MDEIIGYLTSGFGEGEYGGYDVSGEIDPITGYTDANFVPVDGSDVTESSVDSFDAYIMS